MVNDADVIMFKISTTILSPAHTCTISHDDDALVTISNSVVHDLRLKSQDYIYRGTGDHSVDAVYHPLDSVNGYTLLLHTVF